MRNRQPIVNPKWLYPGMGVKRWLVLLLLGITAGALGLAFALRELYTAGFRFPAWTYYVTLQFWPRWVRAIILAAISCALIAVALRRLSRSVLSALPAQEPPLSLAGDDEGFWIGTRSGLVRYRPATGEWQRFGPEDGLAGAPVLHLMAEEDAVWASSRSGVTRFGWRGAGR